MKNLYILVFTILISSNLSAQVSSSCEASDEVIQNYLADAEWLNFEITHAQSLPGADDPNLDQAITDSIMNALAAVYNATSIPERDSVVDVYSVHTFPLYFLNSLVIGANNGVTWIDELIAGSYPTSDATLNSIIDEYGMTMIGSNVFSSNSFVQFETDENYNITPILNELLTVPEMLYADADGYIGDGNDLTGALYEDHTFLTYSIGWGDCPAGCICNRYWDFKVYPDCSVEFVGSYGCPLEPVGISEHAFENITVSPNPIIDHINITNITQPLEYVLFNTLGETITSGRTRGAITYLEGLGRGVYLLRLSDDFGHNKTIKILKN
ncbi:MAG: hypothetical protein ACI8U0_002272 [Flavobacteriales bacterium]|jgi:hypothetical protein